MGWACSVGTQVFFSLPESALAVGHPWNFLCARNSVETSLSVAHKPQEWSELKRGIFVQVCTASLDGFVSVWDFVQQKLIKKVKLGDPIHSMVGVFFFFSVHNKL